MNHSFSRIATPLVGLFGLLFLGLVAVCRQRAKPTVVDEADLSELTKRFFRSNHEVETVVLSKNGEILSFDANGEPLNSSRSLRENASAQNGLDPAESHDVPDTEISVSGLQRSASATTICVWVPGVYIGGQWIPGHKVCL
ncbi:MAG: hypothetical protein JNL84_14885 [Candidatus Accumulibacter sp.]|nr:hypothetical protein [Accumulibacter sp.]